LIIVTEAIIIDSIKQSSAHCMIAQAVKLAIPDAVMIAVDIHTIRYSIPGIDKRYIFVTPRIAQKAIIEFDQGRLPPPFQFNLRNPTIIPRQHHSDLQKLKEQRDRDARINKDPNLQKVLHKPRNPTTLLVLNPTTVARIGGQAPPLMPNRREFGIRNFNQTLDQLKEPTTLDRIKMYKDEIKRLEDTLNLS
jgi:hypothetical protein